MLLTLPYSMVPKHKKRILVVEDDATVRLTISTLLRDQGYDVSVAIDGFDALLQLEHTVPDLILSDLNMPQMSGFELLSVVRRRFPEILVVASSGAYVAGGVPNGVIADAFSTPGNHRWLDPKRSFRAQGRKRARLDSSQWYRPQRQALCCSHLYPMPEVVSICGKS
jgi:CheY-like chemotaxis protein